MAMAIRWFADNIPRLILCALAYALNNMNIVVIPLLAYLFTRCWMSNRLS